MTKKRSGKKRATGEGTLRQRVDGSWEWRTPPSFPVRKSLYAKRQEDVLKKRDEFLKDFEGITSATCASTSSPPLGA
jgi:nitric oxide synthase oxygenase domain/subunit